MTFSLISEAALDAVSALQAHHEPSSSVSATGPDRTGAWSIVRTFFYAVGASDVSIDIFSSTSVGAPLTREWHRGEAHSFDLTVIGEQQRKAVLGRIYCTFYTSPSADALKALRVVCDVYAGHLERAHELLIIDNVVRAREAFDRLAGLSKSGTAISRGVATMQSAIQGQSAAFIVIDGTRAFVEYIKPARWPRSRHARFHPDPPELVLSEDLLTELSARRAWTLWKDRDGELKRHLALSGMHDDDELHYVLVPFISDGVLVAAIVLGLIPGVPLLEHLEGEALAHGARRLAAAAGHIYQRRFDKLLIDPVFRDRHAQVEADLAFVLMPFTESWSERIWQRVLRPLLLDLGLRGLRADDLFGRDVMEDIWGGILRARIVIADITGRNPNVFYELGVAHTLGKDVVLLTQSVEDIPFDLNRYRHIVYADNLDGCETLKQQMASSVQLIIEKGSS